eukprot:UN4008
MGSDGDSAASETSALQPSWPQHLEPDDLHGERCISELVSLHPFPKVPSFPDLRGMGCACSVNGGVSRAHVQRYCIDVGRRACVKAMARQQQTCMQAFDVVLARVLENGRFLSSSRDICQGMTRPPAKRVSFQFCNG